VNSVIGKRRWVHGAARDRPFPVGVGDLPGQPDRVRADHSTSYVAAASSGRSTASSSGGVLF
jgi:hypothetical protein